MDGWLQFVAGIELDVNRKYPVLGAIGVRWKFAPKLVLNAVRDNKPQVTQKLLAVACIACWTVGMITGRLMAYLV